MYDPPIHNNIPFTFTKGGYTPPDFDNVNFQYEATIVDLKAAIIGSELQRDYTKECRTYVLGYDSNSIQILKTRCEYGGIRDLAGYLKSISNLKDLYGYIKTTYINQRDLSEVVKGIGYDYLDLDSMVKVWSRANEFNLSGYLTQVNRLSTDISAYLHAFSSDGAANLTSVIKGWAREASVDLLKVIKGTSSATDDLFSYVKTNKTSQLALPLNIYKIWQQNEKELGLSLFGWGTVDLGLFIQVYNYYNLSASIRSTYLVDLPAFLRTIQPVNITASIMGWAAYDLEASVAAIKYPYDFQFSIYGVPSINLPIFIQTRLAVAQPLDLHMSVGSYYTSDIHAQIMSISGVDLGADLQARGFSSTLGFSIYPKVVYVKIMLNVSYLENRDLKAIINFPCFNSGYRDLGSSLYSMNSSNLTFKVFGTDGSNIKDLPINMNAAIYSTEDKLGIKYFNQVIPKYTVLPINYNNRSKRYSVDTLNVRTTFSQSAAVVYTKQPGLMGIGKALRFEECAPPSAVKSTYIIDRAVWTGEWVDVPASGAFIANVFDAFPSTYSSSYSVQGTVCSFQIATNSTKIPMTWIAYKISAGSTGPFFGNAVLSIKTNEEDDWIEVDDYNCINYFSLSRVVDLTNFYNVSVGFIKLQMQVQYGRLHTLLAYSDYAKSSDLVKVYSNFETVVDESWEIPYLTRELISDSNRGEYALSCLTTVPAYTPLGTFAPEQLRFGQQIDYFEYYYYLTGNNLDSPAIKLLNYDGNALLSITTHSGILAKHTEDQWNLIGFDYEGSNLFNGWCRVRLDFNWDNNTTNITWQCAEEAPSVVENVSLNTWTKDLCTDGTPFQYNYAPGYTGQLAFNSVVTSSSYFKSLDNGGVGYTFSKPQCVQTIRIQCGPYASPYVFEVHAIKEGQIMPWMASYTEATLLLSVDQTSGPTWEFLEWRIFELPNEDQFTNYWIHSPNPMDINEIEMFGLVKQEDQNLCSLEVRLHNNSTDDVWDNGWGGTVGNFYVDDFYTQALNYIGITETVTSNLPVTINGGMISKDLSLNIRPYINRNYIEPNTKHQIIVLKLKDDIEDWRKYVNLTFNNYIKSYYYFSGNQRAYKEFRNEHWEVRIEGYSLSDLPKGVERTKVNTKYLFNLKNYSSIDAAIRDMVDRVTLLRESNLSCSITADRNPSIDLNAIIKAHRVYKSNRVLPVFITGEI